MRGNSRSVRSNSVQVLDSKTILLPEFNYDGTAERKYGVEARKTKKYIRKTWFEPASFWYLAYCSNRLQSTTYAGPCMIHIQWLEFLTTNHLFYETKCILLLLLLLIQLDRGWIANWQSRPRRIKKGRSLYAVVFFSDAFLWVGVGPQPASKGFKVPDEYG